MALHRDSFNHSDLVKLNEDDYVVLASGGPLLKIVCVEGNNMLCEWTDGDEKRRQAMFPIGCLRKLVRFDVKDGSQNDD